MHKPPSSSGTHSSLPTRFYWCGSIIAVVGWLSAAAIYVRAGTGSDLDSSMDSSRQYEMQLERFGGQAEVMAVKFNHWLGSLWQGQHLAYTVAGIATGVALLCFWIGRHMEAIAAEDSAVGEPEAEQPSHQGRHTS